MVASFLFLHGCAPDEGGRDGDVRQTLRELALKNARKCEGVYTYPQALIDGLSLQLMDELRCMDPSWLEYYTPCKEVGCIWAHGPQPLAARPEVLAALRAAAVEKQDYITITAAYRDVAMQYFSRWFRDNCNPNFNAAEPGKSNHQGGRALDVQSYNYWWTTLERHGFNHPIPSDKPHFELVGTSTFRAESKELQRLSVLAFQVLWNKNNPNDLLDEDGIYGPKTKARLGDSPVEGFPIAGCAPIADPCETNPCAQGCDASGCADACVVEPCLDGCDPSLCVPACEDDPCALGCDPSRCVDACEDDPCAPGCEGHACPPEPVLCDGQPCPTPDPNPCRDETCDETCIGDRCEEEPPDGGPDAPGDEGEGPAETPGSGAEDARRMFSHSGTSGCSSAPSSPTVWALLALGVGVARRRRSTAIVSP